MRIVVTGATGNVGTAVVRALEADPEVEAILGIARRLPPPPPPGKTTYATADIVDAELAPHFAGADAVIHLAWAIQPSRDDARLHAVNVDGSRRVFEAAGRAGVATLVHASSVGVYAPGPKDRHVDESWPNTGITTSFYSRHKAEAERALDEAGLAHPDLRVVRLRPGLIFQRNAGQEIRRLFAGPFVPNRLVDPDLIPVFPSHPDLRVQAVHADDVAEAYRLAVLNRDARGAYNIAADPVLDSPEFARLLGARLVPVARPVLRAAADLTWRLRLQPTPKGWVDIALETPLMDVSRARDELGWAAKHTAGETFLELLGGMRENAGDDTPPLDPRTSGPFRVREILTGIGGSTQ